MASQAKRDNVDCFDKPLSKKAEMIGNRGNGVLGKVLEAAADSYHPTSNPKGKVNLGLAENRLCEDIIIAKMSEIAKLPEPPSTLYYANCYGSLEFRQSLQRFLTKYFKPLLSLDVENIFVLCGTTPIIETLCFAFCEPGECIMVLTPCYHRIKPDMWERAGVDFVSVPTLFPSSTHDGYDADIRDDVLERCYEEAKLQGKTIRAIKMVNPNNPTGDVYTETQIQTLLNFANRHELHVIANEIYGLTVFDPEVKFTSILSLPWPDPGRVHFSWGFSKDFGVSGYHLGVLHTRNTRLHKYLHVSCIYTQTANVVQHRFDHLIKDEEWLDHVFLPCLTSRLRARFEDISHACSLVGVKVHKASASVFGWLDMRKFLPSQTEEGEMWLLEKLVEAGVLLMPGSTSCFDTPGFFRMVISLEQTQHDEDVRNRTCANGCIRGGFYGVCKLTNTSTSMGMSSQLLFGVKRICAALSNLQNAPQ